MKLARPIIAASLVFASAAHAQRGRTADENPRPSVLIDSSGGFDIQFDGGTLADYVGALRRAGEAANVPVNVNISKAVAQARIEPIVLRGVNLGVALSTIGYATAEPLNVMAVFDPTTSDGRAQLAPAFVIESALPQSKPTPAAPEIEVFPIGEMLGGGMPVETLLTAVEEALRMSGGADSAPDVRYHEGSSLLMLKARQAELDAVRKVMSTVQTQSIELSQRADRASEVAAERERAVRVAEARVRQAMVAFESAEREATMFKDLHSQGQSSTQEVLKAEEQQNNAQIQVELANIDLDRAKAKQAMSAPPGGSEWHDAIDALRAEIRSLSDRVAKLEAR